jgi:antitoxin component of MazEF toxin-antitoxin module
MLSFEGRARKWGNSMGFTVPKDIAEAAGIKEDDMFDVMLAKPALRGKDIFGTLPKRKGRKTTQQIMGEMNKELYDD